MIRFFRLLPVFLSACMLSSVELIAGGDLKSLELTVSPDFKTETIHVVSIHTYSISTTDSMLRLLLFPEFTVKSATADREISYTRTKNDIEIRFKPGKDIINVTIAYSGKPVQAKNAPWDDGFVWRKDVNGNSWLGVTCQEAGAQLWWPAPERYADKPDKLKTTCIYPDNLFFKGNGRLASDVTNGKSRITTWETTYPINPYNVTLNIADYASLSDTLRRDDGSILELNYYPLKYNREKALSQFRQVKPLLRCLEKSFGVYPFSADGYSVVETSYVGMEHQSAIGYGNGYANGYNQLDYSGLNLPFDFILMHETAHEWWGNSVTAQNKADFWFQEAFCTYAEVAYVEYMFGEAKAIQYVNGKKKLVKNNAPILSKDDSGIDMYAKGALMIHTLSKFAGSKEEWQQLIKLFATENKAKNLSTVELVNWFCRHLPIKPAFFNQYLTKSEIPVLEYSVTKDAGDYRVRYRIKNAIPGFQLPLNWNTGDSNSRNDALGEWKEFRTKSENVQPDQTFSYFKAVQL